jgi:putative peptide zinc metalloprotease protein
VLKSMIPGHKPEPSVLELKRWVRNVVRTWVLVVVPVLLFNLGMILLNFPRLVATAWDSGAKLVGSLQHATGITVAIDAIQLVFLVIPLVGLGYMFVKLAARILAAGWTHTQERPGRRGLFVLASVAAVFVLAYVWWPDARYTPYRPGETGTIQAQGAALRYVGQGHPTFRSPSEARRPLPSLSPQLSASFGRGGTLTATTGANEPQNGGPSTGPAGQSTPTPSPTSDASTEATTQPSATASSAGSESSTSPSRSTSPSPSTSTSATPSSTTSPAPSATTSSAP